MRLMAGVAQQGFKSPSPMHRHSGLGKVVTGPGKAVKHYNHKGSDKDDDDYDDDEEEEEVEEEGGGGEEGEEGEEEEEEEAEAKK